MLSRVGGHTVNMKGPSGEVRCGYQTAVALGAWDLAPKFDSELLAFSARIRTLDEYWIGQTPLTLRLQFSRTVWVWENITPIIDGPNLHLDLAGKPLIER